MAAPDKSLSGLLARIHRDHAPGAADEEKVDKSDIVKQVEAQHAAANALLRRVGGESAEPPTVVRIDGGRMRQDQRASGPRPMLGRRLWWRGRASLCPPAVLLHIVAPREEEGRQSKPHRGLRSGASPPKLPLLAAMTRLPARMATLSLPRCRPLGCLSTCRQQAHRTPSGSTPSLELVCLNMHWLARTVLFALLCTLAIPNTPFSHRRTRSHYTSSPHMRTRHARPSPVLSPRCNPKPPTHTHTHTPRPSPSQPEHSYCSLRTLRTHVITRFTSTMFSAQVKDETVLAALKRILAELDWQNPDAEEVAFEEEEEEGTDTRTHDARILILTPRIVQWPHTCV